DIAGDDDTLQIIVTSMTDSDVADTLEIITTVDEHTDVKDEEYVLPGQFSLAQNYPNPFNMETVISFSLAKSAEVDLAIYDVLGRRIQTLTLGYLAAGEHRLAWNGIDSQGSEVASGLYFYRLSVGDSALTRKMVLLK
ncbi:MAG: FlgD immunoglobulin-like domain containing protein, partial [bacterium]